MIEFYSPDNKTIFYNINNLISLIKNKRVILCGLSELTKKILKENDISKNVDYIFDNKIDDIKTYKNIPIINEEKLRTIDKNKAVIIWGNHIVSFYKQFESLGFKNIQVQYQLRPFLELLDVEFIIETPDYQISYGESPYHRFIPLLVEELLKYNQKINLKPIGRHTKENLLTQHEVKNKQLLFSFHSKGIAQDNVIRIKDGYLQNSISHDSEGFSGWSSLCNLNMKKELLNTTNEQANRFYEDFALKYINNNFSKYKQKENDNSFKFPKSFVFFPLQIISDSVMELCYFNPLELIEELIQILHEKNIPLVIKRHPRCKDKNLELLLHSYDLKNMIILYDGSIHEALSKSKTVYTINSGVGFESLLHLKPIISFGKSDYMSMTKNVKDLEEIKKEPYYFLSKEEIVNVKKFLYYYIENKNIFIDNKDDIKKLVSRCIIIYLEKSYKY